MRKAWGVIWRRIGRIEKAFLALMAVWALLHFTRVAPALASWVALAAFLLGLLTFFRLARRGMRQAIWRLRNRLIVAYLFIAVVPVVLILALVAGASYAVIGQTAVYLVNTELINRMRTLKIGRAHV